MSPHPLIGHEAQREQLSADLKSGNVAHAYLFAGVPSLGKMTIARWFAEELIMRDVSDDKREDVLHRVRHLIHPNILSVDRLWAEGRMEDLDFIAQTTNISQEHRRKAPTMKTDVISIDDVRAVQHRLYATAEAGYSVCIIRNVERMQEPAANALLKILEEPPPGRVFLLTSSTPVSVLPTIRSRCRLMRFERVADSVLQKVLQDVPDEDSAFILHLAQGAPGIVLTLMSDPDHLRYEKTYHTAARAVWSAHNLHERLKLLAPLAERGPDAERTLLHLALTLRDIPSYSHSHERGLIELAKGLKTNANRTLIIQRFAMSIGE